MIDQTTGEVRGTTLRFVGSVATVSGAIKLHGDGGGLRIVLDVPESDVEEALLIRAYRNMALTVTVEPGER